MKIQTDSSESEPTKAINLVQDAIEALNDFKEGHEPAPCQIINFTLSDGRKVTALIPVICTADELPSINIVGAEISPPMDLNTIADSIGSLTIGKVEAEVTREVSPNSGCE